MPDDGVALTVADAASGEPGGADLVIVDVDGGDPEAVACASRLASGLRERAVPVLAIGDGLDRSARVALYRAGVQTCVDPAEDAEEFTARIEALLGAKRPASRALKRLREHSRHLDEQLRLAQRLQMDFLPRRLPQLEDGTLAARLEPAAWVAGDFYDVFRLDEEHLGFYVADAVGHGIPAALLTVFVKKSLQTKRIEDNDYELIPPDEALGLLNADLLSAELQETPFITMVYALYNMKTRRLTWSRAGHPHPILVGNDGALEPLQGDGPLLGIFPDAAFEQSSRTLRPGERLVIYSDGAERVEPVALASPERLHETIQINTLLPVEAMLDEVLHAVRGATMGGPLADDVTLVALDLDGSTKVQ